MILFVTSTVVMLIVITLCQPKTPQQPRTRTKPAEQPYPYQYRHPEAAARHTRPQSTVRFK